MTGSRGPKSNPNAQRRNQKRSGSRLEAPKAEPPAFPSSYGLETQAWWKAWVESPQADFFAATDWQRLLMIAPLVDAYFATPTTQLMAEIRQNEAKLGATASDRDRLGWNIEEPPEGDEGDKPTPSRERSDPRK